MSDPAILVAIVNYQTPSLAIDALRSIIPDLDGEHRRAVIVDNGSADGSAHAIGDAIIAEGWTDRATLLSLDHNRGFGAGNNAALAFARAQGFDPDLIWLLNPDAAALPGALASLVTFFATHERAGILGSRIDNADGSTARSAFRFPTPLGEMESVLGFSFVTRLLHRHVTSPPPPKVATRTDWVSGASLMIRRALYDRLGGFDEGYFLYYEETDLCRRAVRVGAETWYEPAAGVVHLAGQSSGATDEERNTRRRPSYWFASRARYFRFHMGKRALALANIAWLVAYPVGRITARTRRRASPQPPMLWFDMARHGWGAPDTSSETPLRH